MLKTGRVNRHCGQSHTLRDQRVPFARWADAALRTPGMEAGLDCGYSDVRYTRLSREIL